MDDDDYPTEDELKRIREWPYTKPVLLFDFVRSIWHWPDMAKCDGRTYRFATGGWSGNEDIIGALSENSSAWSMCWSVSARGGLHIFDVPEPGAYRERAEMNAADRAMTAVAIVRGLTLHDLDDKDTANHVRELLQLADNAVDFMGRPQ